MSFHSNSDIDESIELKLSLEEFINELIFKMKHNSQQLRIRSIQSEMIFIKNSFQLMNNKNQSKTTKVVKLK
jgi:hypothetical protein